MGGPLEKKEQDRLSGHAGACLDQETLDSIVSLAYARQPKDASRDCIHIFDRSASASSRKKVPEVKDAVLEQFKKEVSEIEQSMGVHIVHNKGRFEYHLRAGGKDTIRAETPDSEVGLISGKSQLKAKVVEEKLRLESSYNLRIADAEEQATQRGDKEKDAGRIVKSREPRLDELTAMEAALLRSSPSQMCKSGEKLNWYFLAEPADENDGFEYHDLKDRPAIFIEGDPNRSATLADLKLPNLWSKDDDYADPSPHCLEALYIHELSHNGQDNLDWDDKYQAAVAGSLGWQSYSNDKVSPPESGYLLKASKGKLFKLVKATDDKDSDHWIQTNQAGQPVDDKMKVVAADKALSLDMKAMMDQATVKPITQYYVNPQEMSAEGMMYYRIGPVWRTHLMRYCPELYKVVAKQDQDEIDALFGPGKKVRMPDGLLFDDTPGNRKVIAEYEDDARMYRQWKRPPGEPEPPVSRTVLAVGA